MPTASMQTVGDKVVKNLDAMISRGKDNRAFFARVAYPMYQAAQMKRWITEGQSEGQKWKPLNEKYAAWKRVNLAGFPGNGEKMLIAKGRLVESVIGRKLAGNPESILTDAEGNKTLTGSMGSGGIATKARDHHVILDDKSMTITSSTPYARYVSQVRPFFKFSPQLTQRIKASYRTWITKGEVSTRGRT